MKCGDNVDKPFEVKEFDTIICNEDYKDDEKYKYLNQKEFDNLVAFIHEFTGDADSADALDFMKIGYRRNVGEVVTIKNYVGLIQLKNGFQIQVLPKIAFGEEDEANVKTKKVFLKMLCSMKDFPCKVFNESSLNVAQMNLYELFINMYLQEVRQLVKRGIKLNYVEQEDNLRYYKGKLLVSENVRVNLAHKERFYVSYEEFHPNGEDTYILTSSIVGIVEKEDIIDGTEIKEGDIVVALESSGIHTNGYTLVRKIMEDNPEIMNECLGEKTFIDAILEPHRCYYRALKDLFGKPHCIHGLAHITGGGICENLNRILPSGLDAKIDLECYNVLPIFKLLRKYGNISDAEMLRTFNLGVGMTLVTSKEYLDDVMQHLQNHGINCNVIGEIVKGNQKVICENNLVW